MIALLQNNDCTCIPVCTLDLAMVTVLSTQDLLKSGPSTMMTSRAEEMAPRPTIKLVNVHDRQ